MGTTIGKYHINEFFGINQSLDENFLLPGFTEDACNMNTDDGNLTVAKGFTRANSFPVPGTDEIYKCALFRHSTGDIHLVFAGDSIYVNFGTVWLCGYTYSSPLTSHDFGFLEAKIGNTDYIIIGNGETGLIKFDGSSFSDFGSSEQESDKPVRYLAMYKNRLFAAGDSTSPNRLYWSQLPGDSRSIEDWGACPDSVNVEGGHVQVGLFDNDPIVAICALSSQLLIFKKNSIYRLYGDKPSNFTIEEIESVVEYTPHTSIIHYGDIAYFMTSSGMYVFDGVSAHLMQDALYIKNILASSDISHSKGARTKDKLYFTIKYNDGTSLEDALLEYNIKRQTYMLRKGFQLSDIFARNNKVYIISGRYICLLDSGDTYDGAPICAYWETPLSDLANKSAIKSFCELYMRGDKNLDKNIAVETRAGGMHRRYDVRLIDDEVTETPLLDEGRCFGMRFSNQAGGRFSLCGGVEVRIKLRER